MKLRSLLTIWIVSLAGHAFAQQLVRFPLPDRPIQIEADQYGSGTRGVILAHGGRFHKESWKPQARVLADAGFLVLALQFRGDDFNPDGSPGTSGPYEDNAADVLAAVAYLHRVGVKTVSAVGASLGGDAVGDADAQSAPGSIARMVFLASTGGDAPEKLTGRKLFLVARDDRNSDGLRLPAIASHYARAHRPKRLVVLKGSAHAQFLFDTDQGPRVMREIRRFLTAP